VPQLEIKVEESYRIMEEGGDSALVEDNLNKIRNELNRLYQFYNFYPFEEIDNLTPELFTPEVGEQILEFLNLANYFFSELAQEASARKDHIYNHLVDSLGLDEMFRLKQNNYNNKMADIVTNRTAVTKIVEYEDGFIRKKDPVFMMPESNLGRAHFYAPYKMINGRYIETKWFNLFIIWLTTIVLYLTLLMDILRKIITYFETLKLRRTK
jgi:hypothetical protein